MAFQLIEGGDFGDESANSGCCYVTFLPKMKGEEGIFRGPAIEEEGFLDVSVSCITEAAQKVGWKSPETFRKMEREIMDLKEKLNVNEEALKKALRSLELKRDVKKITKAKAK